MSDRGPEPWRAGIDAERRMRARRPRDRRETLRRLTVTTAVAAAGLNALLFAQTGIAAAGPGDIQGAIASVISAFFPGTNLRPPSQNATPAPSPPVVTTGGS
jgi:hypothetical protein